MKLQPGCAQDLDLVGLGGGRIASLEVEARLTFLELKYILAAIKMTGCSRFCEYCSKYDMFARVNLRYTKNCFANFPPKGLYVYVPRPEQYDVVANR